MTSRQWRGGVQHDLGDYDGEEESSIGTSGQDTANSDHRMKGSVGPPPGYSGDRSPGAFEEYKLRAKLWLHSTNLDPLARGPRMLQALTGKAFESVKHLIEDDSWCNDRDNGMQLLKLLSKPEYYGKEELESMWNAMYKLFFSELRRPEDDLSAFRSRFEEAVRKVRKHKVELPSEALGFLFLRQAKVDTETMERLITMTNGDLKLDAVVEAMRRLKMRLLDGEEKNTKKSHLWIQEAMSQEQDHETEPSHPEDDEDLSILEQALGELEGDVLPSEEVTEDSAKEILMSLIKQKISRPVQMSYRQVQQKKAEVRNSRGFRPVNMGATRRDVEALKAVTRCRNCNELGHWHRECPKKQDRGTRSASSSASGPAAGSNAQSWWSLVEPIPEDTGRPSVFHEVSE